MYYLKHEQYFIRYKGLIPRALFLGEMRNISHEMKSCMRSKDKLGFARKNFASPVSSSPFYSLRKRKKSANSIESLMCSGVIHHISAFRTHDFVRRISPSWNQALKVYNLKISLGLIKHALRMYITLLQKRI
jgi:hypothetical protein